jgi:IclR family transcriptional regulator, KDG regulon repressor
MVQSSKNTGNETMRDLANKTIRRTFEVLDYFNASREPVRLKDITANLDYPASSASGVLKTLVVLGYLTYDRDTMCYTLTPRLAALGSRANESQPQDVRIMGALQQLNDATGCMVGYGIQSDIYAQYITVLSTSRPVPYRLQPGAVRPMTRCGLGWALLSRRGDAEIDRLRRRVNAQEDDRALHVSAEALSERIGTVRRIGYAFSRHTFRPGVGIIAKPLPHPVGGRLAAIGVAGTVDSLEAKEASIASALHRVIAGLATPEFTVAKIAAGAPDR